MASPWICPHCHEPLSQDGGSLVCVNRHSYDVAREGYVNLLVGRQKGQRGDTPEMLAARRRFFAGGFYEPLRQRIISAVGAYKPGVVAEIGCGEGYYIGGVAEAMSGAVCLGTDIAKDGVKQAARSYGCVQFAVADTNQLIPLADGAVDVALDIFAPRNAAEFSRILASGGRLLVVVPAQNHLAELREVGPLLGVQEQKRQAVVDRLARFFRLAQVDLIDVPLELDGASVTDLIHMTPNGWFLTDEQKDRLARITSIAVTARFELLEFIRAPVDR